MTGLWGGRFSELTDELMRAFNDSIGFDVRLWEVDLTGSEAYARALARAGVITGSERGILLAGLRQVRAEFGNGRFQIDAGDEDIHTAIERRLGELVGEVAGKLHTGRSRNDQVATDTRLWLRAEIAVLKRATDSLQAAFVDQAETYLEVIMPGYTHLQQAQPVRFSHWLLSYAWMILRDRERLAEVACRVNVLPLGSGALAGNPMGIDRRFLADELGFAALSGNSIDAVSDRDYLVEFIGWAALTQSHLSRLAEDLILYSSREFGFVDIAEAYSTGSSLLPQKKNADSLELIRGKTGRVVGRLAGVHTVLKGLPSTYNKDLQEDKEALFDCVDTLAMTLPIATGIVKTLTVNVERMYAAMDSQLLATELADYLVAKGMPFRQAHHLVGQIVQLSIETEQPLWSIPLAVYQQQSGLFERDVHEWLDFHRAVERRGGSGGTAEASVKAQIAQLRQVADDS
jgi:argininosuccinate lyase